MQRSAYRCHKLVLRAVLLVAVYSLLTLAAMAQEPVGKAGEPQKLTAPAKEELSSAPAKVEVSPVARDEEIVKRLQSILHATNWFTDPQVRVEEGVAFLYGQVECRTIHGGRSPLRFPQYMGDPPNIEGQPIVSPLLYASFPSIQSRVIKG